jgi:hypothetical protein
LAEPEGEASDVTDAPPVVVVVAELGEAVEEAMLAVVEVVL